MLPRPENSTVAGCMQARENSQRFTILRTLSGNCRRKASNYACRFGSSANSSRHNHDAHDRPSTSNTCAAAYPARRPRPVVGGGQHGAAGLPVCFAKQQQCQYAGYAVGQLKFAKQCAEYAVTKFQSVIVTLVSKPIQRQQLVFGQQPVPVCRVAGFAQQLRVESGIQPGPAGQHCRR